MKIVQLFHEFPYPPDSGVRCDMWRRLQAFRQLGHQIFGIAWVSEGAGEQPDSADVRTVEAETEAFEIISIGADAGSRLRRIWNLRRYPSYVASRILQREPLESLIASVGDFRPDLIWLEGIHPCWLALELKRHLNVPLAYRAHNIEHRYLAEQARLSPRMRQKLALKAGTWGLERMERLVHGAADRVFDISADDLLYWRQQGFENNEALPPQPDPAMMATMEAPAHQRDIDLLFIGGLGAPNNAAGLDWYFRQVHPKVAGAVPNLKVVIAGRNPGDRLSTQAVEGGAELIANPADVIPLYVRARVLLNPILHGSGVNIKTVDMLATGQPVVTTSKGARGLPGPVRAELTIADGENAFADALIDAVKKARDGQVAPNRSTVLSDVLGPPAVSRALRHFGERGLVYDT